MALHRCRQPGDVGQRGELAVMDDKQVLADAVETALRRVLADKEMQDAFWARGYQELAKHAGNGASQWIGKRLLISFVWAAVGAGLTWLIKSGALK